jgi:hypothetical protein
MSIKHPTSCISAINNYGIISASDHKNNPGEEIIWQESELLSAAFLRTE